MNLPEFFLKYKYEFIDEKFSKTPVGLNYIMCGEKLVKFKNEIMRLDEFSRVNELNILSAPNYKVRKNGKPRSEYLCFGESERRVVTEKKSLAPKGVVDFQLVPDEPVGGNINMRLRKFVSDKELLSPVTCVLTEGSMFSESVDLYSITLSPGIIDSSFTDVATIPYGTWVLPTIYYNINDITPQKTIVIKINPEQMVDETMRMRVNGNFGNTDEAIRNEVIKSVHKAFDDKLGDNVPKTHSFLVRVSPRSLIKNSNEGVRNNVTLTLKNSDLL
jgi:hypothetical protein